MEPSVLLGIFGAIIGIIVNAIIWVKDFQPRLNGEVSKYRRDRLREDFYFHLGIGSLIGGFLGFMGAAWWFVFVLVLLGALLLGVGFYLVANKLWKRVENGNGNQNG